MGYLDWLQDAFGTGGGAGPVPAGFDPRGNMPPGTYEGGGQTPPMPPVQQTGTDAPNLADPNTQPMPGGQGGGPAPQGPMPTADAGTDAMPSTQGGGPAAPPVPLPTARPPGLGAPDNAGSIPPTATPTSGPAAPQTITPDTVQALQSKYANGGVDLPAAQSDRSQGFLGRAFGLDPMRSQQIRGGLAEGLKSVATNANKPGLAAFAGSAGSAMEGTEKTENKQYDQKISALSAAVKAKAAGDEAQYKLNYLKYLNADKGGKDGKGKSWVKPPEQRFLDAQHGVANDPDIAASQKVLEQLAKNGTPDQIAKAQAAHTALIAQKRNEYLAGVGLNPQSVADLAKNPPGTQANPHKVLTDADFKSYVRPGDYYVNPKDGKVYVRKAESSAGGDQSGGDSTAPKPMDPMQPGRGTLPPKTKPPASDDED